VTRTAKHPGVALSATYDRADSGATGATGARAQELAVLIRAAYCRYVVFHSDYAEAESGTLTLWTFLTWVFPIFDATPYIMITAPTSEAGKSRIFDVAKLLVRSPYPVVDPTPAALYHDINDLHPTVLADEADMLRENRALKVVLNSGFQPGTPKRTARGVYDLFCPKAFSGIAGDRQPLTDATLSRCIQIPMRRKAPHEHAEPFHRATAIQELSKLHAELEVWAEDAIGLPAGASPWMPDGLSDRQRDCWEPLFAIADLIGQQWGQAARGRGSFFRGVLFAEDTQVPACLGSCRDGGGSDLRLGRDADPVAHGRP
jgi:hypothetical protein